MTIPNETFTSGQTSRKSAGQTLFSTIAAHGSLLATQTWQAVLWQVQLFDQENYFKVVCLAGALPPPR